MPAWGTPHQLTGINNAIDSSEKQEQKQNNMFANDSQLAITASQEASARIRFLGEFSIEAGKQGIKS
jgi:hypothetical protein